MTDISRDETIRNLKFLSQIRPGDRVDTQSLLIEDRSWISSVKRYFLTKDDRHKTLIFVTGTINKSMSLINIKSTSILDNLAKCNLLRDLQKSVIGIQSLKDTYIDDKLVTSELELLIERVDSFLSNLYVRFEAQSQLDKLPVQILQNISDT